MTLRARNRSVQAHLFSIATVAISAFVAVSAVTAYWQFRGAGEQARRDAGFRASLAASVVDRALADVLGTVAATAAEPELARALSQPEGCRLNGGGAPGIAGRLDVVSAGGRIVCSAHAAARGVNVAGVPWLGRLLREDGAFVSGPYTDPVTGTLAVAIVAGVRDGDRRAGAFVDTLFLSEVGRHLTRTHGETDYRFTIVRPGGEVLDSTVPGLEPGDMLSSRADTLEAGGETFFVASRPSSITGWSVVASIARRAALASTYAHMRASVALTLAAVALALLAVWLIGRSIARPLRRLTSAIQRAGRDFSPAAVDVGGPKEIAALLERFNEMLNMRRRYEAHITHQTLHDSLTGLPNRVLVQDRLTNALRRASRTGGNVAVLFLDLDLFKHVNDRHGRPAGDRLLTAFAARVEGVLGPRDTIARLGGDEFAVLCDDVADANEAWAVAERIRGSLGEPFTAGGLSETLSVSVGIALSEASAPGAESLLRDAEAAAMRAKNEGRARIEFFEPHLRADHAMRVEISHQLHGAVGRNELSVLYQPIFEISTGTVIGVEALARWSNPVLGEVPPDLFIPVAEETGVIAEIGRFVLERACKEAAHWHASGHPVSVSVNASTRELSDPGYSAGVRRTLSSLGLDPNLLNLEITESVLVSEASSVRGTLDELRAAGIELSVDDFGTGYSSLAYLGRFPVSRLKIDRRFVAELHGKKEALVAAIIDMARALGMSVVAEGVESAQQLTRLGAMGCTAAQGYALSVPLPAEAMPAAIASGLSRPKSRYGRRMTSRSDASPAASSRLA